MHIIFTYAGRVLVFLSKWCVSLSRETYINTILTDAAFLPVVRKRVVADAVFCIPTLTPTPV